jgi:hypothetical protein
MEDNEGRKPFDRLRAGGELGGPRVEREAYRSDGV